MSNRSMLDRAMGRLSRTRQTVHQRLFPRHYESALAREALRIETEQRRATERLDREQADLLRSVDRVLDRERVGAHVRAAIDAATLHLDPFPHIVVDNWLPADVYDTMIRAMPPAIFFADRPPLARHRMLVPFHVGPAYSRRVWNFVADDIVEAALGDALRNRFRTPLDEYIATFCPRWLEESDQRLRVSDGRIMLRRPGYRIGTHRDPKWGFITALIYLARPGDSETYGTQLYRVRGDAEASDDKPLWIDDRDCELVKSVPFRANTLLAFLNSTGAHGASIPANAKPANLERYLYQVRLGPDLAGIERLVSLMTPEHRARWAGKKLRRAVGDGGH
jgi:hypothetical protein